MLHNEEMPNFLRKLHYNNAPFGGVLRDIPKDGCKGYYTITPLINSINLTYTILSDSILTEV